ncbi:MAG: hypothetical protein ACFCUQ_05975 [Kiloniellales bacterium]
MGAACAAVLAAALVLGMPQIATASPAQEEPEWSPLFQQGLAAFPERPMDATDYFSQSLALAKDDLQRAFSYHMVARSYEVRGFDGRLGDANGLYEKAQFLFDGIMPSAAVQGDPEQKAIVESFVVTNLQRLGVAYSQSALGDKAELTLQRAGQIAHANPDIPKHLVVAADLALTSHYARSKRWEEAEASLEEAALYVETLPEQDPWLSERIDEFRSWFVAFRSEHE